VQDLDIGLDPVKHQECTVGDNQPPHTWRKFVRRSDIRVFSQ
jgi:hypothetical protein